MESCDIHGAQDRLAPGIQLATWPSSDRPTWLVFMFSQTFLFRKGKRRKGREAFRQLRTHRGREQLADKETQRESLSVKTILRCPEWKTNVLTSPACVRFHQKADITTAVSFLPALDILSLQNCLLQKRIGIHCFAISEQNLMSLFFWSSFCFWVYFDIAMLC